MGDCSSCGSQLTPGSLFCDGCGASQNDVKVARKLRQASFDTVKVASQGLLSPGERLKFRRTSYLIEEAIARSGFGATFRATNEKDKAQVLIKQMIEQSGYDQYKSQLLNAFKREAKFLRRVRHPAFPRGFKYFERNKSFYLVMEFINGKELAKALDDYRQKKGTVPDGLIVYLGMEIAEALDVIHSYGYIYRDLKPQNVMLDGISGRVKLIDFGTLYRPKDKDPLVFESEGYTPPEFLETDKEFLESGDVYSLGALLYEAATDTTPKAPGDTAELGGRNKALMEIIKKCLAADPKERFQTAHQVYKKLRKLTRKGFWPFSGGNSIDTIEIQVLPKTLFPSSCTFCEFCGHADPNSQVGYCPKCRVPLQVGILQWKDKKENKEFYLYSDETTVGKSKESHFSLADLGADKNIGAIHFRIFRRENSLWLEAVEKNKESTKLNQRHILGPVQLVDGDQISVSKIQLSFHLKNAC